LIHAVDFATLFVTAAALAMDAVAVAIASGLSVRRLLIADALKLALLFGFFQGAMPIGGYWLGHLFSGTLEPYDHWIAFAILSALGIKLLRDSRHAAEEAITNPFLFKTLVIMAFATSIDAFAVGVSLALEQVSIATAALVIGGVTALLCLPAIWFGTKLGARFAQHAGTAGGLVLIAIGCKILMEHLALGI
jgi:putative Mn2+ efflux pump MntP